MDAKDVYSKSLVIGDKVRVRQTGRIYTVLDLVTASVKGDKVNVIVQQDLWYDIGELDKV